jgi:hypothetical protein
VADGGAIELGLEVLDDAPGEVAGELGLAGVLGVEEGAGLGEVGEVNLEAAEEETEGGLGVAAGEAVEDPLDDDLEGVGVGDGAVDAETEEEVGEGGGEEVAAAPEEEETGSADAKRGGAGAVEEKLEGGARH